MAAQAAFKQGHSDEAAFRHYLVQTGAMEELVQTLVHFGEKRSFSNLEECVANGADAPDIVAKHSTDDLEKLVADNARLKARLAQLEGSYEERVKRLSDNGLEEGLMLEVRNLRIAGGVPGMDAQSTGAGTSTDAYVELVAIKGGRTWNVKTSMIQNVVDSVEWAETTTMRLPTDIGKNFRLLIILWDHDQRSSPDVVARAQFVLGGRSGKFTGHLMELSPEVVTPEKFDTNVSFEWKLRTSFMRPEERTQVRPASAITREVTNANTQSWLMDDGHLTSPRARARPSSAK
eukprot:CAMPEP_0174733454 /NCGR_PEP_ID=MMETSP1094-20130205/61340_1 /TAXON_ID=156173 /ORGANISM="Chrysochromulina brevifilum, Strain UTEX LB 985" /LENGTH=289 /DNA_ID=CAMNT_0015936111 /DNA_START=56 /DNA_END=925 /DNA_ORIENTATION=+